MPRCDRELTDPAHTTPYVAADHSGGRWAGVAVLARAEHGVSDVVAGLAGQPDGNEARWVEATVAGDVNVCPSDLDVWDVSRVHGATHVTADERNRLQAVRRCWSTWTSEEWSRARSGRGARLGGSRSAGVVLDRPDRQRDHQHQRERDRHGRRRRQHTGGVIG